MRFECALTAAFKGQFLKRNGVISTAAKPPGFAALRGLISLAQRSLRAAANAALVGMTSLSGMPVQDSHP
jgi:hypothetical protein